MNIVQIFSLSFDALRERKVRSALTVLMVVVGSSLMVALNGLAPASAPSLTNSSASWLQMLFLLIVHNRRIPAPLEEVLRPHPK